MCLNSRLELYVGYKPKAFGHCFGETASARAVFTIRWHMGSSRACLRRCVSRQELADQSERAAAWREVITDLQREGEDKRHKTGVKPQPKPSDTGLAVP